MDERFMIDLDALPLVVILPVCLVVGFGMGLGYFLALRMTADLVVAGASPLLGLALTLGRLSLLGLGFYLAVLAGGFALLAALAGVLCARWVMLRPVPVAQA